MMMMMMTMASTTGQQEQGRTNPAARWCSWAIAAMGTLAAECLQQQGSNELEGVLGRKVGEASAAAEITSEEAL